MKIEKNLSLTSAQPVGELMVKHKRKKVTVRIEQQRSKPRSTRSPKTYISGFMSQDMLISGGAIASILLCTGLLMFNQPWSDASETQTESLANLENIADAQPTEQLVAFTPEPAFPKEKQLKVGKGDTLIELLTDTGVSHQEAHEAVAAIRKIYDPRRINSGQEFDITLEASEEDAELPTLSELKMPISGTATIQLHKIENGEFVVKKIEVPVTAHPKYTSLPIQGSLYQTARKAGLSPKMIMELMKGFSYDVDFQRDVQRGHTLEVVVDELKRDDGSVVGTRNLRYAKLELGRKKVAIYRYTDSKGNTEYYNAKGESLKRGLLRTPVDGARISSGYGMRKHPVLGYNKMHKGMDFAAPTGTPIYAAGDGIVTYAGPKGSYGNYVSIKHNSKYSTAYAHAHRIAKGIRNGSRVRQGQIIAYVGSTGRSTGPHLHYEVMAHGQQVNPSKVQKFNNGTQLAGKELKNFKSMIGEVEQVMASATKPAKKSDTLASKAPAKNAKKPGA